MIIIIDGYNVLKQLNPNSSEKTKQHFISQLSSYAERKHHTLIIVFDGGDQPYDYSEHYNKVKVIYSGYKQTADDVIKALLEKMKNEDALLVSSDRELVRYAHRNTIESSDALAFYHLIKPEMPAGKKSVIIKNGKKEYDDELSRLMEEESRTVPTKHEHEIKGRKSTGHQPSKQEKRLLRKIKKL
jgi:hypothetical protein